jgi:hypothetical protein
LFYVSTAIFAFLHASVYLFDYYDMRLREISDIQNRYLHGDAKPLAQAEKDFYIAISKEYD